MGGDSGFDFGIRIVWFVAWLVYGRSFVLYRVVLQVVIIILAVIIITRNGSLSTGPRHNS